MRRIAQALAIVALLTALMAAPAEADDAFGLKDLQVDYLNSAGSPARQAGEHPFAMRVQLSANSTGGPGVGETPIDAVRDLVTRMPAGFIGDPHATPRCSGPDFATIIGELPQCSDSSAVGVAHVTVGLTEPQQFTAPVYNLEPPPGTAAKLGFAALSVPVTLEVGVNPEPPYNVIVSANKISQALRFYGADLTIWGNPASPAHDAERGSCIASGGCSANVPNRPFLTLPRSCTGSPMVTRIEVNSWQNPGQWLPPYLIDTPGTVGCPKLGFAPRIAAQPTTDQAESPTGLDVSLDVKDEGLANPEGNAQSDIRKIVVTLPAGITANPSLAEGLLTCSQADLARETVMSEPGEGCPQASNVGRVEVETPILEGTILKGQLFIATQNENPFGSLLALYMVIKDPELGILVKVPGKVEPDARTGQLVTTFGEAPYELPQFPLSHVRLHLREGGRSPLITPPGCATYETKAVFTPWANPQGTYTTTSSFEITRGVNGGPCPPSGTPPFAPGFSAGTLNNNAGAHSPFLMRLTRRDGDQDLTRFDATLPPGAVAKLAGVPKCPEAAIAATRSKTGKAELASPSCPANSRIGTVIAGAGVGSQLTYVPGSVYLAGPLGKAHLSVVGVVPAVAGPFDVGTVVTRQALTLDPVTAQAKVDGALSDPIPHILQGIPLKVRDIRVSIDRSDFTLNPTNCGELSTGAALWGGGSNPFSRADDVPVSLAERFQAANCSALAFKPKLSIKLKGATKRGGFPALRAELKARPGDANIGKAVVTLPHSAFLEQAHMRTICTRVQYAAGNCPKGSIYGRARAFTPLLDEPLEGPVYLRSSSNPLPDMVVALKGIVDIDLVGRIDSANASIRSTFAKVPDAAVSKFVLTMQGGKKGLIVNSRNLCAAKSRATIDFTGQNGKAHRFKPVVKANGCGKAKKPAKRR